MPKEQKCESEPYYLSLDWYRHGLDVSDKYESDNAESKYPVAFHGTHSGAVSGITQNATRCKGGSCPQYTVPFAVTTDDKTGKYCIVYQCRVRPKSYSIHPSCVKEGYTWRTVDTNAIRSYGLLLKKKKSKN
ncbi:unnamed protein product [Adineta ricciae]|uniref:Uncharacterized protein n=1 Tax=Adineta ricciae TaxID=249248 RepID=A0A814F4U8_ADIRI|nr:unnamed protein product [Adineta ricciae]CAF0977981.1 unnamed protein product [Adineta ricciae]